MVDMLRRDGVAAVWVMVNRRNAAVEKALVVGMDDWDQRPKKARLRVIRKFDESLIQWIC